MRISLVLLATVFTAASLGAQQSSRAERFLRDCDDNGDDQHDRFCEVRDFRLKAPAAALSVDGRDNGGVTFSGWDQGGVLVRALISASGESRAEAQDLAKQVTLQTSGDRVYAEGPRPRRHAWWSVSYEVFVPRRTDLEADTRNGGVSVDGVEGRMNLRAVNGGIHLINVGGDIRAETTNGGVHADLSGSTWKGQGLELETTNGGVELNIPRGYNAELETGTVNGGMNIDFPITVQGSIGRRITTRLGTGGPRVRATTTNGGVRISQR